MCLNTREVRVFARARAGESRRGLGPSELDAHDSIVKKASLMTMHLKGGPTRARGAHHAGAALRLRAAPANRAEHGESRARERPHLSLVAAAVLLAGCSAAAAASLRLAAAVRLAAATRIPTEDPSALSRLFEWRREGALDDPVAR